MTNRRALLLLAFLGIGARAAAAEPPANKPSPAVRLSDLRKELKPAPVFARSTFPWSNQPKPPAASNATPGEFDAADTEIQADGSFTREVKTQPAGAKTIAKDVLTITKNVLLLQPAENTALEAQFVEITRDADSGSLERLFAKDEVRMVSPDRKVGCHTLSFVTQQAPDGKVLEQTVRFEGRTNPLEDATVTGPDYRVLAPRVEMDQRRDVFRALGGARVFAKLPPPENAPGAPPGNAPRPPPPGNAPPAPGALGGKAGPLPSLTLIPGQDVELRCEGDLVCENFSGRLWLKRNALVRQEDPNWKDAAARSPGRVTTPRYALEIAADDVVLTLDKSQAPPAGETASPFSGPLRSMEATGRVEIRTLTHVFRCDRTFYDLGAGKYRMEMLSAKQSVHIYVRSEVDPEQAAQLIRPQHRILVDAPTMTISDADTKQPLAVWRSETFKLPRPIPKRSEPVEP